MNWRATLGLAGEATADEVVACHKRLAKRNHPDLGGSVEAMSEINAAKDAALKELNGDDGSQLFSASLRPRRRTRPHRRKKWPFTPMMP